MGWTTVETENAKYVVIFGSHFSATKIPAALDSVIIEATDNYQKLQSVVNKGLYDFEKNVQYGKLLADNRGKPFFVGDIPITKKRVVRGAMTRVVALAALGTSFFPKAAIIPMSVLLILPGMLPPGKELKLRKPIRKLVALTHPIFEPALAGSFRNAIIAEKAEKSIAPQMRQQLGRKPVIGIVYGAAHAGIVEMLKNPTQRRRQLSRVNIRKEGWNETTQVFEMKFNPATNAYEGKIHGTKIVIPRYRPIAKRTKAYWQLGKQKAKQAIQRVKRAAASRLRRK